MRDIGPSAVDTTPAMKPQLQVDRLYHSRVKGPPGRTRKARRQDIIK